MTIRICVAPPETIESAVTMLIGGRGRGVRRRGAGERECGGTGYRGHIPLFEVLTMTDEIALLVNAPTREIEAMAVSQGMATLREDGVRLAAVGITTLEEVRRGAGETVG